MKSKMKNVSDAELLISVATELATNSTALFALASATRGVLRGNTLDGILDQMSAASRIARDRVIERSADISERARIANSGSPSEGLSLATSDELADLLLELASRLLAGNAPSTDASPTHQEPARAAVKGPVVAKVGGGFRIAPIGVAVERAMAEAGIPGRVVGARITVDRGDVELESPIDGGIVVRWWPAGR